MHGVTLEQLTNSSKEKAANTGPNRITASTIVGERHFSIWLNSGTILTQSPRPGSECLVAHDKESFVRLEEFIDCKNDEGI